MANTRDVVGEATCLDALVAQTITEFEDDGVINVGNRYCFGGSNIESVNLPNCTTVASYAFKDATHLVTAALPSFAGRQKAASIAEYVFNGCTLLESVTLDSLTNVGKYMFQNCYQLKNITLPSCSSFERQCFENCVRLQVIDAGASSQSAGTMADTDAFKNCAWLKAIILRNPTKTSLSVYAPTNSGEVAYYVNASTVDTFKTNNSSIASRTFSIEQYPQYRVETISDSWSTIISKCANGDYATDYTVGDRKRIEIDGNDYYMQLIAKDADVLASDGITTVPTTWILYKRCYETHRINPGAVSQSTGTGAYGGWENTELRAWLNDTVYNKLPSEVKSAIKEVRKYSDYVMAKTTTLYHDQQTADKIWIPSEREVFGDSNHEQQGVIYSYLADTTANRYRLPNTNASYGIWALRTTVTNNYFAGCSSTGALSNTVSPSAESNIAFGFCI